MKKSRNTSASPAVCETLESRLLLSIVSVEAIAGLDFTDVTAYISEDLLPDAAQGDDLVSSDLRYAQTVIAEALLDNSATDLSQLSTAGLRINQDGALHVYVHVDQVSDSILQTLEDVGLSIDNMNSDMRVVQGWVDNTLLDSLAVVQGVRAITLPDYAVTQSGAVTTAGDGILNADDLRTQMDVTGDGIKIGVIANGLDHWANVDDSGDLPAYDTGITVHSTFSGKGDEGTAMLEIIYDLAPDADLYFAGRRSDGTFSSVDMISAIDWLVGQGCDVIVDDMVAFDQPMFEDGTNTIADTVAEVVSGGVVYVTVAGNYAYGQHYQDDYADYGDGTHEFAVDQNILRFYLDAGGTATGELQWSDPWGASGNNYNLYLFASTGSSWSLVAASQDMQNGDDNPCESITIVNSGQSQGLYAWMIHQASGSDRELEFFLRVDLNDFEIHASDTGLMTSGDSIFGHAAVESVITVGAIDASDSGNDDVEAFSSRGPSTIYTNFSTQTSTTRNTLDVCGIDGVGTKVGDLGYFSDPFYGTSAAAPHIAAIAALLLEIDSSLTPADIHDLLTDNAVDIEDAGYDNISGYGRADALATVTAAAASVDLLAASDTGYSDSDDITKLDNHDTGSKLQFYVAGTITGAAVTLYGPGDIVIGTGTGNGGTLTITTNGTQDLTDGANGIYATQEVADKLESAGTTNLNVTVDTVAPEVSGNPTINDGATQRNTIESIEFTFNEDVSVSSGALQMYYYDGDSWETTSLSSPTFSQPAADEARWSNSSGLLTVDDTHLMIKLLTGANLTDIAGNQINATEVIGENLFRLHKLSGDMDGSKDQDSLDIDTLRASFGNGAYDLDGDNDADEDDVVELVEQILETFYGDATLDGFVGGDDYVLILTNWGTYSDAWADGDMDGDGFVGAGDLTVVLTNWGSNNPGFELLDLGADPAWS